MATETDPNTTTTPVQDTPVQDTSKTATQANAEQETPLALEVGEEPKMSPAQVEATRRAAFEAATKGKPFVAPTATDDATKEDDDTAFDAENGVDEDGKPIKGGDQNTPAKGVSAKDAPKDTKPDGGKGTSTPQEREALVKAKRALALDGWADADFDGITPAKLIAFGEKARERHSRTAAALREAADIKRRNGVEGERPESAGNGAARGSDREGAREGVREGGRTTTGAREQRAQQPDRLDALLAELEGAPPARDEDDDAANQAPQETPETKRLRAEAQEAHAELLRYRIQDATRSLLGDFPQLRGKEAQQAVARKMDELDPKGQLAQDAESLARLTRDAAFIVFGPQLTEQSRAARREQARKQRDGQMDAGDDSAKEPAKKMSKEEIRRAAYDASKAPTPEESRRRFHSKVGAGSGSV